MEDIKYYFPPVSRDKLAKLQLTQEGKYSITKPDAGRQIVEIIKRYVPTSKKRTFVDGTAGMGGDLYYVSPLFAKSIGVEKNTEHASIANSNLRVLGIDTFVHNMSILDYLADTYKKDFPKGIDVLWIDPPWGGPDYKKFKELDLFLDGKNINEYINYWIKNKIARAIFIKAPYNYRIQTIIDLGYTYLKFEIMSKHKVLFILLLVWDKCRKEK